MVSTLTTEQVLDGGPQEVRDTLLECLVWLARYHQRPYSADALCAGLPLPENRLTPALFLRAAERAGLSARVTKRSLEGIPALVLPAVLLLQDGRACVLVAREADGTAEVVLPETGGARRLPLAELAEHYSGHAILVQPVARLDDRAERLAPAIARSWFWGTLLRYRREYLDVMLASLVINFFALASSLFAMNVYDRVVPNNAIESLWALALGIGIVIVFDFMLRVMRGYFLDKTGKKLDVLVSTALFQQVMSIQLRERPASAGSFANQLREFEVLRDFLTSATLTTLIDLPFAALLLAVIAAIGGPLVWAPLAAIPLVIAVGLAVQGPLSRVISENFAMNAQRHGLLVEAIDGLETIKSLSAEGRMQGMWETTLAVTSRTALKSQLLSSMATNFTYFTQQVVYVAVVVAGVYLIGDGQLTVGGLVAVSILTGRALLPLGQVAGLLTRYQHARMALQSLNRIMNLPVERPAGRSFLHRPEFAGDIEFSNVRFSYPGAPLPALDGVSFRIARGERVALLGRIGSGKSTVAKLVLGLYYPDAGNLLVDGADIQQLDPVDLRRNIGYVPQDVRLFYGTVRANIAMGQDYPDDAAILRAAQIAGVDRIVARHPSGFDLPVGEHGQGLSGGQRQAIATARAVVGEPRVLVLDEPTSAMDHGTEQAYIQAMRRYAEGRTMVLVTHKPTMLALVDRLIVLDAGRVVADGPRDQVLQALSQGIQVPAQGRA
ncbi:MAG TPA: type I secretion system permease/ATPase [Burkholderiales bacterium]